MKVCNCCKAEKSSTEFFKDSSKKDGLSTLCKPCKYAAHKKWVAAHPENSVDEIIYNEGQQVLMHRDHLGQMLAVNAGADAWTRGMLVLDNVRLGDMVRELNRYRRGHLGVDPDVADLRISGSFALNNVELALNSLLPALPVQIEQHTPWWVTVSARPGKN